MRILFVDDSGSRRPNSEHEYFCLGALSIDTDHLGQLRRRLQAIKTELRLRAVPDDELKFNQIGRPHDTEKKPNPLVRIGLDMGQRRTVGLRLLQSLSMTPSVKVFNVGVRLADLGSTESAPDWAFSILFERFEYSMNRERQRVGLVICDQEDVEDELIRRALYTGTSYSRLVRIAETVMFVPSDRSPGVQFADFVAGAGHRWWNYGDYRYLEPLWPVMHRADRTGSRLGAGIKSFRVRSYPPLAAS